MKPLSLRRLTDGERALAAEVFADALDTARVRLLALPVWPRAFVTGARLVVWPAARAPADFTAAPLAAQSIFVHELVHVWQAQTGVNLILGKLAAGDAPAAYAYDLSRPFGALNIEQQAMAVQHAFLARRGGPAPYPVERYAAHLPAWTSGQA